jgi:hypothetical protein
MPRKISRKGLVKKLDRVFSIYIRTRHAKEGMVRCVTCKALGLFLSTITTSPLSNVTRCG